MIEPAFDNFAAAYNDGRPQVLWTRVIADLDTPLSALIKLTADQPNSFLLESVEGGAVLGRYSFIGTRPDIIWRASGAQAQINRNALDKPDVFEPDHRPPIESLRALINESQIDMPDHLPPMAAGCFGYLGYDMIRLIEDLPGGQHDVFEIPDSIMMRPTIITVFDNIQRHVTIVTPVYPGPGVDAESAYQRGVTRLERAVDNFQKSVPEGHSLPGAAIKPPATLAQEPKSNTTREEFYAMVDKARDYILAGDVFQVVLSQRFERSFDLPPLSLYRSLRRLNPSPFLVYLNFGGFGIVCSSPEILVRLRDDTVTIRPIAGTRKRGKDAAEDAANAADLLADPKERAEHLMLLDLGRNDVGRVAEIGTVKVTEKFIIENYSHVMHIVSNVEGGIKDGLDALDALFAGFPAGTVSGAPKVRAMEIIDELEKDKRGVYAGCVGYFGANGAMDTCIALRTALIKDGKMYVQAGAGIVADSNNESEYEETCNKARALFTAAEDALRLSGAASAGNSTGQTAKTG